MRKKILFFILLTLLFFAGLFLLFKNNNNIPNDYIAIFHGEKGSTIYKTYIYKIDNDQANYGFKYINVVNNNVIEKGELSWTDEAFSVARNNNAYSYVTMPNSNKRYSIEEFQKIFLMN